MNDVLKTINASKCNVNTKISVLKTCKEMQVNGN